MNDDQTKSNLMTDTTPSNYINDCYRNFAMYVLQTRAFPAITDGLKSGGRRLLWTGRNGQKQKTATLAGATMPLHPHADASDTIDTLTKPYRNNYPLFTGIGSFGTRLKPDASGAPRYTSVKVSEFTEDVVFRDIELVPMQDNYDSTLREPVHFLPLCPIVLLNPTEGIGVGFSCTIVPRALGDVIDSQLAHLRGDDVVEPASTFVPFRSVSTRSEVIKSGNTRWWYVGRIKRIDTSTLAIIDLPFGMEHTSYVETLSTLVDDGTIQGFDDHSSDEISIVVKFGRGALKSLTDDEIISKLRLRASVVENMNLVDFTGDRVVSMTYAEVIKQFTDWRLGWYVQRFELLKSKVERDIQRYRDVITAIKHDVGSRGRAAANRSALIDWLTSIGVIYTDYIADLPIYRLTTEEAERVEQKLAAALESLAEYQQYLDEPQKRRNLYQQELLDIKARYHKPVVA